MWFNKCCLKMWSYVTKHEPVIEVIELLSILSIEGKVATAIKFLVFGF